MTTAKKQDQRAYFKSLQKIATRNNLRSLIKRIKCYDETSEISTDSDFNDVVEAALDIQGIYKICAVETLLPYNNLFKSKKFLRKFMDLGLQRMLLDNMSDDWLIDFVQKFGEDDGVMIKYNESQTLFFTKDEMDTMSNPKGRIGTLNKLVFQRNSMEVGELDHK